MSPAAAATRAGGAAVVALLAVSLAAGCSASRPAVVLPAAGEELPWRLPSSLLLRQMLLRAEAETPEGHYRLKLSLRLASAERFLMSASDTFGRTLWTLEVAAGAALAVDHRQRSYCRAAVDGALVDPLIGFDQVAAIPRILAGRLPLAPAAGAETPPNLGAGATLDYRAAGQRRVVALLAADRAPERWTLWQGGEPWLWWVREGSGGRLDARGGALRLSWQPIVVEDLPAGALGAALADPPASYREARCEGSPMEAQP